MLTDEEVVADVDEEKESSIEEVYIDEAVTEEEGGVGENSSAFSSVSTVASFILTVFTLHFFVEL